MIQRIAWTAVLIILAGLFLVPGLTGTGLGQVPAVEAQSSAAACTNGYALWANSTSALSILDWSGSGTHVQGKVRSNWSILLSGSGNVIDDAVEYAGSFVDSGDDNQYPSPVQVAPAAMPVAFNVDDYRPGGRAAAAAEQAGLYYYISGDLHIGDDGDDDDNDDAPELRDGLYYVTGDVAISADNLHNQVTIVASGNIEISGSGQELSAYSDELLLFSGQSSSWSEPITISGGGSVFQGLVYASGGRIEVSGSDNVFYGGLFARALKLNGSSLTVAYEPSYCQTNEPTPTPPPTATPGPTPTATSTPRPASNPIYLPLAGVHRANHTGEPNDTCGQAYHIAPGMTHTFLAEDREDWYVFDLGSAGDVTVELGNFVPRQGQIAAFRGDSCGATTFLQNNGDNTPDKTLYLGPQPAGRYFLFVGNDGALNSTDRYTLTVEVR